MIKEIAFYNVGGISVLAVTGIAALICLAAASVLGGLATKGKAKMGYHKIAASAGMAFAAVHLALYLSRFL